MTEQGLLTRAEILKVHKAKDGFPLDPDRDFYKRLCKAQHQKDEQKIGKLFKEIRQAVAIEYKKSMEEAETNPFLTDELNFEHKLIWRGHASAYSEVLSWLDS